MITQGRREYHWYRHTLVLLTLLLLLAACGGSGNQGSQSSTQSTPSAPASGSSQMVQVNLGIPQAALHSPTVGNLPGNTVLHVLVTFKPNDAAINKIGTQTVSPNKPTDASALANQIGITDQQYQQVKAFFGVQDVKLTLNKLHTTLELDAQASTFANLLHTTFVYHQYQGRKFFAPTSPVMIPQAIAVHIQAITGLDNYSKPPSPRGLTNYSKPLSTTQVSANNCATDPNTNNALQVADAYGLNAFYAQGWRGQGTTIILPEFESFNQSDVLQYMSCVQFHGKVSIVDVANNPPTQAGTEALLDLEMVAGLAPDANIVVYEEDPGTNGDNFWVAFDQVLSQISSDYTKISGPTEVSISWGGAEDFLTVGLVNAIDTQLRILTLVDHINVFTASGDCGAYDSADYPNNLDVDFPGTDPSVIDVGGTALSVDARGNRAQEVVWSGDPHNPTDCENTWGSGGGLSQAFDLPNWQQAPGVQNRYSNGRRQVPDVSSVAWTVAIFDQGKWTWDGGTSAAAPIWASGYALVNQGLAIRAGTFIVGGPNIFYWLAQKAASQRPFFDITQGSNLYYSATPGWDYASGLGSPNFVGIYNGLIEFIQSAS
jgi:subtilase family serine protease